MPVLSWPAEQTGDSVPPCNSFLWHFSVNSCGLIAGGGVWVLVLFSDQQLFTTGWGVVFGKKNGTHLLILMKAFSWEAFLQQQSENKLNILFQRDYPYPAGNSWHKTLIHLPLQTRAKLLLISLVQNQALIKSMASFAQLLSLSASLTYRPDPLWSWRTQP